MRIIYFLFFVFLFLSVNSFSQNLTITAGKANTCKGDTVNIPVKVKGFNNICAIGVRLAFDTLKLKYIDCINVSQSMPGVDYANVRNFVTLGWFSVKDGIVANIKDDDNLFVVRFVCLQTSADITYDESACMASDCYLKEVKLNLIPGRVDKAGKCR